MSQQSKPLLALAVLISGNGSNLQAIIDAINNGLAAEIKVVISNKADAYGLERARAANIPTEILSHRDYATREAYDMALQACIDSYKVQLIILAGFMRILTPTFVEHFAQRILNIHPSLLPKYPGLDTHQKALQAGDKLHGASVHIVTADLDNGPVIAQASVAITPTDDINSLQTKVHAVEHKLYPYVIDLYTQNRLQLRQECVILDGQVLPKCGLQLQ